jgi:hypothetical protein
MEQKAAMVTSAPAIQRFIALPNLFTFIVVSDLSMVLLD